MIFINHNSHATLSMSESQTHLCITIDTQNTGYKISLFDLAELVLLENNYKIS